jgi:hypothetical protein
MQIKYSQKADILIENIKQEANEVGFEDWIRFGLWKFQEIAHHM